MSTPSNHHGGRSNRAWWAMRRRRSKLKMVDNKSLCTMKFQLQVVNLYALSSPPLSRYFFSKFSETFCENNYETRKSFENMLAGHSCPLCGSLLYGTKISSIKIKPRKKISKKTARLIKLCKKYKNWNKLNLKERKKVIKHENTKNKLVINCIICGKSETDCVKRKQKVSNLSLPSTPITSVRSLFSTPISSCSKNRTPNSETSLHTPSSSAKKKSAKRKRHSQLQMMLEQNKQEEQRAQNSPLHGFLKSL